MMTSKDYILKKIQKIKKNIAKSHDRQQYDQALYHISLCAGILYSTNIYYEDEDLENTLESIATELSSNTFTSVEDYGAKEDTLLFYDGFGLNERGLIQIYLKALCKIKKVIYVTFEERKGLIPDVQNILDEHKCERRYINRRNSNYTNQIEQLNSFVKEFRPGHMFFYSVPDDVVATPLMYAYADYMIRYQINLTDHAFWLGAGCIDKCIEFREYGARISVEYRNIPKKKIRVIPFYPIAHREKEFQGYPFEVKPEQKVIFSGGALYKTLGGDSKYYKIIEHILETHKNVIFWYAGNGDDSQMKKILDKFPGRAYLTGERSDLLQVLEHSRAYLSTYPMCGGLMFQYAAMAGCVPVTLKSGNISDGFLINQKNINVEFDDLETLYNEIDKLIDDDSYATDRSKLMKKSVISDEIFDEEVANLVQGNDSNRFVASFEHIDTEQFRAWYLEGVTPADIDKYFVRRESMKTAITHFPSEFFHGALKKICMKSGNIKYFTIKLIKG